jgi:hypothetical protein
LLKRKLLVILAISVLFTSCPFLWSLEASYRLGYGYQLARESVVVTDPAFIDNEIFNQGQGLGQLSFCAGDKDTGGFIALLDFTLPPMPSQTIGDAYSLQYGSLISCGLGYAFRWPLGKSLQFSLVPMATWTLVTGEVSEKNMSESESWAIFGSAFGFGASTEIDWFPFDTGWGIIDGFFAYMATQAFLDLPDFPRCRLGVLAGIGLSLR